MSVFDPSRKINNVVFEDTNGELTNVKLPGGIREKDVNFWDYDGTLVYSYTLEEARQLTELPPLPDHSGIGLDSSSEFSGWNWTLEEVNSLDDWADAGAQYNTTDGFDHFFIEINRDYDRSVHALFTQNPWKDQSTPNTDGVVIDWGDGTTTSFIKESSATGFDKYPHHVYENLGRYEVIVKWAKPEYGQDKSPFVPDSWWFGDYPGQGSHYIKEAHLGTRNTYSNSYEFFCGNCPSMEKISIPLIPEKAENGSPTYTQFNSYAFYGSNSLKHINCSRGEMIFNQSWISGPQIQLIVFPYKNFIQDYYPGDWSNYCMTDCISLRRFRATCGRLYWGDDNSPRQTSALEKLQLKRVRKSNASSSDQRIIDFSRYGRVPELHLQTEDPLGYKFTDYSGETIVVPEGFTNVCFDNSRGVHEIILPNSVTELQSRAFAYCYGLYDIDLSNIKKIGNNALSYTMFRSLEIPEAVSTMPNIDSLFAATSVRYLNKNYSGETKQLSSCDRLTNLELEGHFTSIKSYGFQGDKLLTEAPALREGVKKIGDYSYNGLESVLRFDIPTTVESIGSYAFGGSNGSYNYQDTREYHFRGTTPPTLAGSNSVWRKNDNWKIYVPYSEDHSVLAAYQAESGWAGIPLEEEDYTVSYGDFSASINSGNNISARPRPLYVDWDCDRVETKVDGSGSEIKRITGYSLAENIPFNNGNTTTSRQITFTALGEEHTANYTQNPMPELVFDIVDPEIPVGEEQFVKRYFESDTEQFGNGYYTFVSGNGTEYGMPTDNAIFKLVSKVEGNIDIYVKNLLSVYKGNGTYVSYKNTDVTNLTHYFSYYTSRTYDVTDWVKVTLTDVHIGDYFWVCTYKNYYDSALDNVAYVAIPLME